MNHQNLVTQLGQSMKHILFWSADQGWICAAPTSNGLSELFRYLISRGRSVERLAATVADPDFHRTKLASEGRRHRRPCSDCAVEQRQSRDAEMGHGGGDISQDLAVIRSRLWLTGSTGGRLIYHVACRRGVGSSSPPTVFREEAFR